MIWLMVYHFDNLHQCLFKGVRFIMCKKNVLDCVIEFDNNKIQWSKREGKVIKYEKTKTALKVGEWT